MAGCNGEDMASQGEEASLESKYGGIVPKKKPLISNDNERAYFDSADWALGKQGSNMGQNAKNPVEPLRPKLQKEHRPSKNGQMADKADASPSTPTSKASVHDGKRK